ncbi:putative oxidoreductase C-terminal domain-containing protein [Maribacter chungangensis]|uniref:Oxidoreductase C-terminal domain-containing protein n=1 Tax=Maribacter chungangensis TaxID=1069117 RepID=A0ABW3B7S3_9FLAO
MKYICNFLMISLCLSCGEKQEKKPDAMEKTKETVKLMTLDPGHFHAALVHKTMYPQVDSTIYLYAPKGSEALDFLNKIESYNSRVESPTQWNIEKNFSDDFLGDMITDKPGNVMVVAGKNSKKIDYILAAVEAGLNVYADKPLVINRQGFEKLKLAFEIAEKNGVLIYDIMTERFESTTMMQKLFASLPSVFGELVDGTLEEPAISKESVHHFFKYVSGSPLVRPAWFFDVNEEGDGIVDVTTHLVDMVQWGAFPGQIIDTTDIQMLNAKRWPTVLSLEEFTKVTKHVSFPDYLQKDVVDGKLHTFSNGEMSYKIKGKHASVSVAWNYKAPEGTGDTHYSVMRGTKCDLLIKQGNEENFKPILYIESDLGSDFENVLNLVVKNEVANNFPGTTVDKISDGRWRVTIPDEFKIGHEAHFTQVTENYLTYLVSGKLPVWEVPNMITKYYITIAAYEMALANKSNTLNE